MKIKNLLKKKGFSLVEISIAMFIIIAFASFVTLNMDANKQTAQQEAEKLANYIHDLMRKADRSHQSFAILFHGDEIIPYWDDENDAQKNRTQGRSRKIYSTKETEQGKEPPVVDKGFTVDDEATFRNSNTSVRTDGLNYNPNKNEFNAKGHFKITLNKDSNKYHYVIIYGGRIRLSSEPIDVSN